VNDLDRNRRAQASASSGSAESDGVLAQKVIAKTAVGWTELLQWADTWPERIWAIEGSGSLGRGVAQFLARRGEQVHEVNPRWTAKRRRGLRRPVSAMRWMRRRLHVCCAKRARACRWSKLRPEPRPACNCGAGYATISCWIRRACATDYRCTHPAVRPGVPPRHSLAAKPDRHPSCSEYSAPGTGQLDRVREEAVRLVAEQVAVLIEQERISAPTSSQLFVSTSPLYWLSRAATDRCCRVYRRAPHAAARPPRAADRCACGCGTHRSLQCPGTTAPCQPAWQSTTQHAAVSDCSCSAAQLRLSSGAHSSS
jgi:hypothetical protein